MKRVLWIGVGAAVTVVVVHQVARSSFGIRFRESMAHHEQTLRAALLPDEEALARARETRAAHGRRSAAAGGLPADPSDDGSFSDALVLPDDGTDYF